MDALILFSHGSLLCGAGETLQAHARALRARGGYSTVEVGFMNYSQPTFEEAVERCVVSRAERVVVVPYFLIPGKFVTVDMVQHVDSARRMHPELSFVVAEPLGYDPLLADALLDLAARATGSDRWRQDYERAGAYCESDPDCPLFDTSRCSKRSA